VLPSTGMESRKAWRNRDPAAGEAVLALLEVLREGLSAQAVGLFDDDRADPGQPSPPNFWEAFDEPPCAAIDWNDWYRRLRAEGRVDTICGCGQSHHLMGFLLHHRWALILVAPPRLPPEGAAAISSSLRALADRLPPGVAREETPAPPPLDPEAPITTGGLLWWVRKPPQ
jgi:hypothetical protein